MNNPPRRPPGPPPPRAPIDGPRPMAAVNLGNGDAPPRPRGPPPNVAPLAALKPPPRAPPPIGLQQSQQRPPIDNSNEKASNNSTSPIPPPKTANNFPAAPAKAGGISMFEQPDEKPSIDEQADKKPRIARPKDSPIDASLKGIPLPRGPPPPNARVMSPTNEPLIPTLGRQRPQPPTSLSAGIPAGQPQPPAFQPEKDARPPPPVKAPPKNRAPPKEDRPDSRRPSSTGLTVNSSAKMISSPPPPTTEPPFLKGKKEVTAKPLTKRRERDMPEFEESDDDEDNPTLVKQPLPFGVIKKPVPPSPMEVAAAAAKKEALLAIEQAQAPITPAVIPSAKTSVAISPPPTAPEEKPPQLTDTSVAVESRKDKPDAKQVVVPPPTESKMSEFVPPPPASVETLDKHFDDSKLGKTLTLGRLSIKCIEGFEIKKKDEKDPNARIDPFLKFRLGVAERHPWKRTETRRKQNANPKFENEIVFFDITDPGQFIFQEDMQICIELWNKSTLKDELIGSVTMSVVRFLKQPFVSYTEKVPIYFPGMARTQMKLLMEFVFEEARSGMFQITLFEGRGLRNIDPMGHQDPFVQFSLGKYYKKRSKSVKGGGTEPYFAEEDLLLWADQDNWVNDLHVDVLDEDAKEEKPIGSTHFSLLPYMKIAAKDAKEDVYDLFHYILLDPKDDTSRKEVAKGELIMRLRFLPAGTMNVVIERAKDLAFPEAHKASLTSGESIQRMDPFITLTLEGKAVKVVKRTAADKDGGADPVWQDNIKFDIVDQYLLDVEVFNQSVTGKDISLGGAQISLLSVFRTGSAEFWTTLKQKKANGGVKEVGDVLLKFNFVGPMGVAFPQFRPEVDSFDDTLRKIPGKAVAEEKEDPGKREISTIPEPEEEKYEGLTKEELAKQTEEAKEQADRDGHPPEFTDAEIMAAFKFIDLDHNNFVGAAEIRHILVCMGEMITDEEIDMMISMVDLDGDGQVSYKEFRALVLHPNPGVVDLLKEVNKAHDADILQEKQAMAGKRQGMDLNSFHRQKEMTQREQKKKMIAQFVIDNEVNFEYIKQAYMDFVELPKEKRPGGRIKFPEFCKVLRIEPITDYKNLHAFYDNEEMGDMDIREFLLSMMNFVDVRKDERVAFSFNMFDEAKTGFISQREVEEILRGNHMISIASVQRKAETVMKQAHKNSSGAITLKEFIIVSKKFPNILLPAVGYIPAHDGSVPVMKT
mmetsp:Transcript_16218/g.22145  ORF Transcript_16218/g.22145 Transcript_16218/m.22145 type:complete len:1209 (-) Transcript_16218:67-3693(-)